MTSTVDQVVELNFGIVPEAAISAPVLLRDDWITFLTFSAVRPTREGMLEDAGTAIVEIEGCKATKFGLPDEDAFPGHPLFSQGLDDYGIFEILNSSWIAEQIEQFKVVSPDTTIENWGRHFVIPFRDSTFECVARDLHLTISQEPYEQILHHLCQELLRRSP